MTADRGQTMDEIGRLSRRGLLLTALIETAQFCSSKVLTVWLRH